MYRIGLAVIAVVLGASAPAMAFWGAGPVSEPRAMIAIGAGLVIAAGYSRGRGKHR